MNGMEAIKSTFERLPEIIDQLDAKALLDLFVDGNVNVNVPRYGQIGNNLVFSRYLKQVRLWLSERESGRYEFWGALSNDEHVVINYVHYFMVNDDEFDVHKELHIPVSIMFDMHGDKVAAARVYYNTCWIAGHNIVRPPMMNEDTTLLAKLPEAEQRYFQALWDADTDTIINDLWAKDGYFMGTLTSFNEGPALIKTLEGLFEDGKNTELRLCTANIMGSYMIVEYMNHRSGGRPNTPSSGLAIYHYNDEGKMYQVRLAGDSGFDHTLWPTL